MRNHPEGKPRTDLFTRELRRLNGYTEEELREWLLLPGMKFGDTDKWWQPGATREKPHEGVDLLIFLDASGKRHHLPPGTAIPPLLGGTEVARIADFMGETVILAHDSLDDGGRRLHTFYGHLQPTVAPSSDKIMAADRPLGKIAAVLKTTTACPPHLHLSIAWIDESYPIQDFRWADFGASKTFRPGDPMAFMSRAGI